MPPPDRQGSDDAEPEFDIPVFIRGRRALTVTVLEQDNHPQTRTETVGALEPQERLVESVLRQMTLEEVRDLVAEIEDVIGDGERSR